jgi:hypothetical protein
VSVNQGLLNCEEAGQAWLLSHSSNLPERRAHPRQRSILRLESTLPQAASQSGSACVTLRPRWLDRWHSRGQVAVQLTDACEKRHLRKGGILCWALSRMLVLVSKRESEELRMSEPARKVKAANLGEGHSY